MRGLRLREPPLNGGAAAHAAFTARLLPWPHRRRRLPFSLDGTSLKENTAMPTPIRFRKALPGIALAAFALGAAAAGAQETSAQAQAQSTNQTVPDKAADAWITTKVKSEFATTKGIHATDINVDTTDGVVTLSGGVASSSEKAAAVKVARAVKGVKSADATGLTVKAAAGTP